MAAAHRVAVEQGVDIEQFWRLTPWQTRQVIVANRDCRIMLAWQTAALSRTKKLPKLDRLLIAKPRKDPMLLKDLLKRGGNRHHGH